MLQRSWLFVPGDSHNKLAKIAGCGADCVIIDLEDSVSLENKSAARSNTKDFLKDWQVGFNLPQLFVRVNALATSLTSEDLSFSISKATTGIMLPKAEGGANVAELAALMRVAEARAGLDDNSTKIIAIATETARGVLNVGTYLGASSRLVALAWGAEDLSADIGAQSARNAAGDFTPLFSHARTMVILGAASANIAAIDGIWADFRNFDGLQKECQEALRDGFSGKMAIHPNQIPIINEAFRSTQAQLAEAQNIVDAFAEAGNPGVLNFNGRMLDRPHLRLAMRILAQT